LQIAFLLVTSLALGQGTFVYDQQSVPSDSTRTEGGGADLWYVSVGQSFTPAQSSVGFIRLIVDGGGPPPGVSSATFYVNLLSDSINGPILASTDPVTIQPRLGTPSTFFFSTPVTVTPGDTYYFQVVEENGDNTWGIIYDLDFPRYPYPAGNAYFNGVVAPHWDLWFREGIVVPEPSSALLFLAGFGALAIFRRGKTKAPPG
jgi:hypothetical protein